MMRAIAFPRLDEVARPDDLVKVDPDGRHLGRALIVHAVRVRPVDHRAVAVGTPLAPCAAILKFEHGRARELTIDPQPQVAATLSTAAQGFPETGVEIQKRFERFVAVDVDGAQAA